MFSIGNFIYNHYYKIDITPYTYTFLARIVNSDDKQHSVSVTIYKTVEDSDIAYIMGTLGSLDIKKDYSKNVKTIFWQEVSSESIKEKIINDETLANWIEVAWLDSQTVTINGMTVNINDIYDYRRK